MKMIFVAAVLFLFSVPAIAAGPYDGIWTINEDPSSGYFVITEKNGQMIVIGLNLPSEDDPVYYWDAVSGVRQNNTVRLYTIVSAKGSVIFDVVMTSESTLTITQALCTPVNIDYECKFPNGTQFHGTKIF